MKNHIMPLSPHLGIYKMQMSSVLSILHRISGVVLFIGMILLLWWVVFICYHEDPESTMIWKFFSGEWGIAMLIAWSYSLFFHFCTGIRHLFWEHGQGFSICAMHTSGWSAVIASVLFTAISWYLAFYLGV